MINPFEEIKYRVSVEELLSDYGIYPANRNKMYRCINHSPDKKPSASIRKNGYFCCFACGFYGDVITVAQHLNGYKTPLEAAKAINDRYGLGLFRELTESEKQMYKEAREKREYEKQLAKIKAEFEKNIFIAIVNDIKYWENIEQLTTFVIGENYEDWKFSDLHFTSLKKQKWLNWLCDVISNKQHEDTEWDYTITDNKNELLDMLFYGELKYRDFIK